ncbi:MAG: LytTR family transcriptional regulator [Candidatus Symbiothrix sp.]|jgi:DNA-binding LytR/AlgR family response regulator|nr:LytTR family transcriptional regulator [Candidatus Symbiothrix sp.]
MIATLNQKIPVYLYAKRNLIRLVLLTALFALVFINLYKPFSSENWYHVSEFMFFVFSSLVILTGVLVVVISRIIMFFYTKKHTLSWVKYGLWILAEIFFMSLFYTIYVLSIKKDQEILSTFKESVTNTSLVLLLPYAMLSLYFSWQEKEKRLKKIEEEKTDTTQQPTILLFYDEKGDLCLSIQRNSLLYIESADNYVIIWYLHKGSAKKFILRSTLKALEEQWPDAHILRCHRSFLVNFEQIKTICREKDGIYLDLGVEEIPAIPISKTYSEKVVNWLMNHAVEGSLPDKA